jgi:hypothetical protein
MHVGVANVDHFDVVPALLRAPLEILHKDAG